MKKNLSSATGDDGLSIILCDKHEGLMNITRGFLEAKIVGRKLSQVHCD